MKRLCCKKWVRFLAGICCILALNGTAASFAGIIAMEGLGIYDREKEDVLEEINRDICRDYSIYAISGYQDDFHMEKLNDTQFRYGVIQTDQIDKLDLNDRKIYTVCNFDEGREIDRKELGKSITVYSCDVGEETKIHVASSLFDHGYVNNGYYRGSPDDWEAEYVVRGICYTSDTDHFYYQVNGEDGEKWFFPAQNEVGQDKNGNTAAELVVLKQHDGAEGTVGENPENEEAPAADSNGAAEEAADSNETGEEPEKEEGLPEGSGKYEWSRNVRMIIEEGVTRYLSEVKITTYPELADTGRIMSSSPEDEDYQEYVFRDGVIRTWPIEDRADGATPYFVVSYMAEPLAGGKNSAGFLYTDSLYTLLASWERMDDFSRARSLIDTGYRLRHRIYWVFLVLLLVTAGSLCLCILGAGHRNGDEKVLPGRLEKIPFDLFFILAMTVETCLFAAATEIAVETGFFSRYVLFFSAPAVLAAEVFALVCIQDFAVRMKLKNCLKHTVLYWCCHNIWVWLKKNYRRTAQTFASSLPFLWKAWAVMGILALLELIGISATVNSGGDVLIVLWLLEKAVVYPFLIICLLQMHKLFSGAEKIAAGEAGCQVDTEKMLWDFKKHGENLNRIREGINGAVEQRMKSERFKTELITNVSHDIKTPLTSIVNYVDLLEKEDIKDPKIQEYLEILSRQSARLKKLIEDLMEASKASTGNLSVTMEPCNARILVTQIIGEFQEKLSRGNIELIVQGAGEDIFILADTRHLYRIFDNLMNNICKYALESSRAYVNVERRGNVCRIIFRNISKYPLNIDSSELMERFVRGDSSRNTEGSGLGLSIAKSLTELMKGEFELVIDGDLFKVILGFSIMD